MITDNRSWNEMVKENHRLKEDLISEVIYKKERHGDRRQGLGKDIS